MVLEFNLPTGKQSVTIPPSTTGKTIYDRIWAEYVGLRLGGHVARSGVILCGCFPEHTLDTEPVVRRTADGGFSYTGHGINLVEKVSDHTLSCINLLELVASNLTELFSKSGTTYLEPDAPELLQIVYRIERLLRRHDNGEAYYFDKPDDGSRDEEAKNSLELECLVDSVKDLGDTPTKVRLVKDFINFQYPLAEHLYPGWTEFDGRMIQLAKLIDKFDAVFSTLIYESQGHPGNLMHKKTIYGISDADANYCKFCGTSAIADTWAAHTIDQYHAYYGFPDMLRILYSAVMDVRGKWYPWYDSLAKKHCLHIDLSV